MRLEQWLTHPLLFNSESALTWVKTYEFSGERKEDVYEDSFIYSVLLKIVAGRNARAASNFLSIRRAVALAT